MSLTVSPERLARGSARRPWLVVALWFVLFITGGLLASGISDVLTTEFGLDTEPESRTADRLLQERLRGPEAAREMVIVGSESSTVDDPAFRAYVVGLLGEIRALGGTVAGATSYYETGNEGLVSADRHRTILPVTLTGDVGEAADTVAPLTGLVAKAGQREGFTVLTAGVGSIAETFNTVSQDDLAAAEMIGLPVALLVLVLVFGAVVAAGVPLVLALLSIAIAVGVTAVIGRAYELSFFVVNIITMIGLAVGIDYSLFVVHRFREERARGLDRNNAIARTGATASRAVLFSGGTVIVGLAGLMIVPSTVYRSLAIGAIAVVVVAVAAALTLLPAVLALLGDRVNALRLRVPRLWSRTVREQDAEAGTRTEGVGFWGHVAELVMRRPLLSVVASVALLIVAAAPYVTIKTGTTGVSTQPEGSASRRAFAILERDFSGGLISPAEIVVDAADVRAPTVQAGIARLQAALARDPAFGPVTVQVNDAGDLALVSATIAGDPQGSAAHEAINRLRNEHIPGAFAGTNTRVQVAGQTAKDEDFFRIIADYTPWVFAFVLGLSFVLLLLIFRSIVVPIKALVMNLLSVGAAYGLLVLVFQHGVGNELFGFQQTDTIEAWLPLFLFAILFGLSMDYHVFLLSRIREKFDETGDNAGAVAHGVRSTAGIITGAALIMVAVFSAFAAGELAPLQQTGFGLAVAVILDATVVRSVLVPASMQLLGGLNWYLPRWLAWLPTINVEGSPSPAMQPTPAAAEVAYAGDRDWR